ncbi:hypothetical protein BpHYR1_026731 [Brachionus plicatilis]|uniref:EF-hand domain-containing protein n=1 Tax=Brachionus plicatilis TaxID=10195 RepID=A0A3M7RFJ9_BRAPC|nr:hypothetical protein BpHYR1_026731 [Brachionus plicatilis]
MNFEIFQNAELNAVEKSVLDSLTERAAFLSQQQIDDSYSYPPESAHFSDLFLASSSVNQIASDLVQLQTGPTSLSSSKPSNNEYLSQIEQAILRSNEPISIGETEEISVNGHRGIWANKSEVINWQGDLAKYDINEDTNPAILNKKTSQTLDYVQELAIRYLRPPTPPAPGEIIINQLPNEVTPPAPPLIIRQQPARPLTPEPLIIREAPPAPPAQVGRKVITISGKKIPPPPRKVIIERLPSLPAKPQSVLIERWLPYAEVKRKVIFNRPAQADPIVVKPRNVIVQWDSPQVNIKKEFKYLGVIRANPVEYVQRYGSTLRQSNELPKFAADIQTPDGLVLAADQKYNYLHELYGDVSALNLIDLDREGLGDYKSYLSLNSDYDNRSGTNYSYAIQLDDNVNDLIEQIFLSVDRDQNGRISAEEAEKLVLKLNSKLGRRYGEDDVRAFFATLDRNHDGTLDLEEFRRAFLSVAN